MRSMRSRFGLLALLTLLSCAMTFGLERPVQAQSATPSAEQIDAFRNLSQDQQDTILRQLGSSGSGGGIGIGQSVFGDRQSQTDRQRQGQESDQERNQRMPAEGEEVEPRIPVFKAEDWAIVEIDFTLPPRPVSLEMQALSGAQQPPSPQAIQAVQAMQATSAQTTSSQNGTSGSTPSDAAHPSSANSASRLTDEERKRLQALMELIRSRNPYQLTRDGALLLPGFAPIPLLGLTEEQATLRLRIEPAFRDVDIRITRLPLKKTGPEGLKPFGYDLFNRAPSTFAPATNVPVPSDYIVGSGDELDVQLYGSQNRSLRLFVGRDGRVSFPEIGPINVGGQLFSSVRASIESRVERQLIGVRASVSMGETRSIRVFVLGEARRPGSYVISGLGTMTSALYAAGGVKTIGSLRRVALKRQGAVVRQLDLYDLLIRGDTTDDAKLLQGDVIFVPPVGATASIDGEVKRPAIYEIKNESNIADLVQLAGGLTSQADRTKVMLTRIDANEHRIVMSVDLSNEAATSPGVRNGDLLHIARLRPTLDSGVLVQGHVFSSGAFAYHPGLRLTDIIHSVDDLKPDADIHYLMIRRELPPDRRITVLSADLAAALRSPGSKADTELMPRDRIIVFDLTSGRDRIIHPVLDELRLQSSSNQPTPVVQVDGRVKIPGHYPLEKGMTISGLVRAGGGLADSAYGGRADLTRYRVVDGDVRQTELIGIDLDAAMRGDPKANVPLEPFDNLSIREIPEWMSQEIVTLVGEVRFPGTYAIKRGETLRSVVARAGGLTQYAFPEGAVFTREELRKLEQQQMDLLAERMQRDLAVLALQSAAANQAGAASALSVGQSLLGQLRAAKAVGRLVINLPRTLKSPAGSITDVILRNGDALIVPRYQQQVTVIGEVQTSTSHLYSPELSRDDYITLSGGTTKIADRGKIYVVRANGSVIANGSRWFQDGSRTPIKPGDTIVVPLNTERIPALPFWQAVTTILYNVAISVAAVRSF